MSDDNAQDGAEPSLASAGSQPVAYEVWWDGAARQPYFVSADEKPSGNWTPAPRIVPLYSQPQPTLTDAEQLAIAWAAREADEWDEEDTPEVAAHAEALRGLAKRLF